MTLSLSMIAAFLLDLFIGDPPRLPHPVRWMGHAIEKLEPVFRRFRFPETVQGIAFSVTLISAAWLLTGLAVKGASILHPLFGWAVQTIAIFYALSVKSLKDAAMGVYRALHAGDLETARARVAMTVSRDTKDLDAAGVARAAVETVAENLVDGVISPLFFAAIGGAPLAIAFKMASTLDSMVGYKTGRYIFFGKASARIDDAAGLIPSRLSVPVISIFAQALFKRGFQTIRTAVREGHHHASPNAGYPEAAFAGALDVKLNGPNSYHGKRVEKPYIGIDSGPVETRHIPMACRLMVFSAAGFMGISVLSMWIHWIFFQ